MSDTPNEIIKALSPAMVQMALATMMLELEVQSFEFMYLGELWQVEIQADESLLMTKLATSPNRH